MYRLFDTVSAMWNGKGDWHDAYIFEWLHGTVPVDIRFLLVYRNLEGRWLRTALFWGTSRSRSHGWYRRHQNTWSLRNSSNSTAINTPKKLAEFANTVGTISCLYLQWSTARAWSRQMVYTPIPRTIKMHKIVRSYTFKVAICNKFPTSVTTQSHFVWLHDFACGHNETKLDNNTCCHSLKSYNQNEEWLKCPVCQNGSTRNVFALTNGELTSIFGVLFYLS